MLASEDMITQRIDTHLAGAKRATVSVGKHLGDGRSETPAEKAYQTSGGKRVSNLFVERSDRKPRRLQLKPPKFSIARTQ